jgi:hypothetical protein
VAKTGSEKSQITASVADELLKLAGLRENGVLTEEEFQAQKAAILRSSDK